MTSLGDLRFSPSLYNCKLLDVRDWIISFSWTQPPVPLAVQDERHGWLAHRRAWEQGKFPGTAKAHAHPLLIDFPKYSSLLAVLVKGMVRNSLDQLRLRQQAKDDGNTHAASLSLRVGPRSTFLCWVLVGPYVHSALWREAGLQHVTGLGRETQPKLFNAQTHGKQGAAWNSRGETHTRPSFPAFAWFLSWLTSSFLALCYHSLYVLIHFSQRGKENIIILVTAIPVKLK